MKANLNVSSNQSSAKKLAEKNAKLPDCFFWDCDQVCEFFEELKLGEYKETLRSNKIDGKRLIYLDSSHLPKIGIRDFKHMMLITKSVRNLIGMNDPYWNRSISEIPRDIMELFLERKSFSGQVSDSLNYEDFEEGTKDSKWQPILTNQGLILPH